MSRIGAALVAAMLACGALAEPRPAPVAQFAPGSVPGTLRYQVVVAGPGGGDMTATLGTLDNLEVLAGPVLAQEVDWREGETRAMSVLTWVMRARHGGPIGVGPTRVRVGAEVLATEAVRGVAFGAGPGLSQGPARQLRMETSASRVMVGEPVVVQLSLDAASPADGWEVQASFPESWSERLALAAQPPAATAPRISASAGLVLAGWVVIPVRAGELEIPAAMARRVAWPESQESPLIPARTLTSRPATVDVLPLPPAPAAFSGAVGEFRFTRRLASAALRAGELATVETEVSGEGNLPLLDPPPLPLPDGVEAFPAEETHEWKADSRGLAGFRRWRSPIEFGRPGRYELPKVTLCSYRPGAGYAVQELPALTVEVMPAPAGAAAAAPAAGAAAAGGISPLLTGGAAFIAGAGSVLAVLVLRSRRKRHRRATAAPEPEAELRDLHAAVERWARIRFGVSNAAAAEAMQSAGCPAADAAEAAELLQACERLRFSPGLASLAELLPDLRLRVSRLTGEGPQATDRLSA
ncbi:MAG TPA: hypothetical protein VLW17_01375 [Thermoanaerobaculaceae bacterium]|nr:hypothetical protein [Thermoanaerobaculaceae bacterium]